MIEFTILFIEISVFKNIVTLLKKHPNLKPHLHIKIESGTNRLGIQINDIIDITPEVEKIVSGSKIKKGVCLISSPGSTCGITTIEYEPELLKDFKEFLEKLVPSDKEYRHDKVWGEKNGFSHILSAIIKPFLAVPLEEGKLILGQWQQIVFLDFEPSVLWKPVFVNFKIANNFNARN